MRPASTQPTPVELGILQVLWEQGPSTVRQVHELLGKEKSLQYTTVLKMLLVMQEKGLVTRDERDRSHIYQPVKDRSTTQKGLLRDLLDRAFGGSSRELVAMALQEEPLAADERQEIKELLEEAKKRRR